MKIALVRARYNPFGGAERFAERALAALAADTTQPLEIAVLARRWDGIEATAGSGMPRVRLVACDPFHIGSVWRDASFARAVRRHLADEAFDLVQSHERIVGLPVYRAGDGVHAAWLARRSRATGFGTRLGIALNPHHGYLMRVERAMFEHPALRAVICNSEMVRREIVERFAIDARKLVVIRNGIDLQRFHPAVRTAQRAASRATLGLDDDTTVFTMVGSGFERKGVQVALRALAIRPDAALIVVGHDKHRVRYQTEATRRGLASRVRFVGPVADPMPYYAAADAFVAPTLYDPFPNAALEAFGCGLAVITTDACGAAELIDDDVNGWVVPAGDIEALARAMTTVTRAGPGRREALSMAARRTAEPHSLGALSDALLGLYRSLVGRHPDDRLADRATR